MYPTAPHSIPRVSNFDHFIDDLFIPKDCGIDCINVQNNEQKFPYLCKEGDQFNPDRFLQKEVIQDHFSFIPFSSGPRNCIGQHLAMIEAKTMIIYLLKNFVILENEQIQKVGFNHQFVYTTDVRNLVKLKRIEEK